MTNTSDGHAISYDAAVPITLRLFFWGVVANGPDEEIPMYDATFQMPPGMFLTRFQIRDQNITRKPGQENLLMDVPFRLTMQDDGLAVKRERYFCPNCRCDGCNE